VDETKISILGTHQQVWGITDGREVIFRLTETRETGFLQKLLDGFQGVLVSDFYGGYDGISCRQQMLGASHQRLERRSLEESL